MTAATTPAGHPGSPVPLDVEQVREDFPILASLVRGKPLVYLDNAATTQKPQTVIDAVTRFYSAENANIHRGVHYLSERATVAFDAVRTHVATFLNAPSPRQIVFTRGTTESINLVAQSFGRSVLGPDDEILITGMEHHSNIVPWQLVAEATGATVRAVPITDAGELDLDAFDRLLNARTRLVAVVHLSNALGTINPVRELADRAHESGSAAVGRWGAECGAFGRGCSSSRLRLLRLFRPQVVWTNGRGCALWA